MTTAPLPAATDTERTDARALTLPLVAAQVAQNIAGGLLLGNAVAALMWLAGADLTQTWRWPVGIGWLIAGAAGVRAFADEFRADRRWRQRELEHRREMEEADAKHVHKMEIIVALSDEIEAERNALRAERDALDRENTRLQSENASLKYEWRKARATPRTILREDLVEPEARRNARHLVSVWADTGKRPSRSEMVPSEMTRSQWDAAYTELGRAGLLDGAQRTEAQMLHALSTQWAEPVDYA